MQRYFTLIGMAFLLGLVMICCWDSQVTIHAQEGHSEMNGSRNRVREMVNHQYSAQNVMALRVRDDSGNIRVLAARDTNEIALSAEKLIEGKQPDTELQTYLARVQPTAHLEGDTLVVQADYPREEFAHRHLNVSINYVIVVPQRLMLDLLSHSGNIEAKGAKGNAKLHSDSGNVILTDAAGTIEATSASGNVVLKGATAKGVLKLHSDSGNVHAEDVLASDSALKVTMNSDSGNVEFEGDADALDLSADSGNVIGKVTGTHSLSHANLHTSSGNVALTVPTAFSATIHARTDSGTIQVRGLSNAYRNAGDGGERHSVKFTLGDGSAPVTLETNSGNVEFNTR